jgi:hypothetical protein
MIKIKTLFNILFFFFLFSVLSTSAILFAQNFKPAAINERTIFNGSISKIEFAGPDAEPQIIGAIEILTGNKETRTFLVHKYTLILVNQQGKIYVADLKQLKPGWQCSVAFDLENDREPRKPTIADNMIVEVPDSY